MLGLTGSTTGLILVGGRTSHPRSSVSSPFSSEHMLFYGEDYGQHARLPADASMLKESKTFPIEINSFDVYERLMNLLTTNHSFLNPTRAVSPQDELDILFGSGRWSSGPGSAPLGVVLPWLLTATAWQNNIR